MCCNMAGSVDRESAYEKLKEKAAQRQALTGAKRTRRWTNAAGFMNRNIKAAARS